MIVTVTLNPLLERRLSYSQVSFNTENRNGKHELKAGGKGINVSRQLNHLNIDNIALTFLGGANGKLLNQVLNAEGIKHVSIHTLNETREASVIVNESSRSVSTFFATNSSITSNEVNEFLSKLEKMIENCEVVVFAGSSPCKETDSIFPAGIEMANRFDKVSILDTYGKHLETCIEKSPTIIHNNIAELENSLGVSLQSESERIDLLDNLYKRGIKQAYLTNGGDNLYAANFDYHYKVKSPEINTADPTGSGDAFSAGIIYAWHNSLTFENGLALAAALGALNASQIDVCTVRLEEALALQEKVQVSPVGKKMKILDVTPR